MSEERPEQHPAGGPGDQPREDLAPQQPPQQQYPPPPYPQAPPAQPHPGQSHPGQSHPGQPYPGQPYGGQPHPGQPYPGQPYPAYPYAGYPFPRPPYPGQPYAGYPYPGHSYAGYPYPQPPYPQQPYPQQPYPQQPYPGQPYGGYPYPQAPLPPAAKQVDPRSLVHPHDQPREYHEVLRTWTYESWKPVLGLILLGIGTVVVMPLLMLPVLLVGVLIDGGPFAETVSDAIMLEDAVPAGLAYLLLAIGSWTLVAWLLVRYLHGLRPRWLTSVVPGMRWRWLAVCFGLAAAALVASVLVGFLIPVDAPVTGEVTDFTTTTAALIVIALLATPLQAAAEEYVFRGYMLQAVGSLSGVIGERLWTPARARVIARWFTIVVTAFLFALAHGAQNFPLFFDRFAFGIVAAWLVIRTGGLEAAIAMHILNNLLAFGVAITYDQLSASLGIAEVSYWNILSTLTQEGVFAVLVVLVFRRMGLQRRSQPPMPADPSAPVGEGSGPGADAGPDGPEPSSEPVMHPV